MCEMCDLSLIGSIVLLWYSISEVLNIRRNWVHPFFRNRLKYGFENRILPMLLNNQISEDNSLNQNLASMRQDTISVREKVAVTLRYLATGDNYRSLELLFLISSKTIQKIIIEVCDAIIRILGPIHLKLPSTELEWLKISRDFEIKRIIKHCLGSIDGKHIKINRPPKGGSQYWNYKHFDSIVLLGISDMRSRFVWVECGIEGRFSDGGVFARSDFKTKYLDQNNLNIPSDNNFPFYFIADDAFPLSTLILKPYKGSGLLPQQEYFNKLISGARVVTEDALGMLVARFRVFTRKIELLPENAKKVTIASCILHNMIIDTTPNCNSTSNWREIREELNLTNLQTSRSAGHGTTDAKTFRDNLAEAMFRTNSI